MYLLAVDTATNAGGAALARNAEVVGKVMVKTPMKYSDNIIPIVDFLLNQHGLQMKDLDALIVPTGPGSFTGLRIGMAVVKAFGQALDIPAVGISTLEALAYRFRHVQERIVAMIDARRQQVFAAAFEVTQKDVTPLSEEVVVAPADWLKDFDQTEFVFVGDGAQLYRSAVESLLPGSRVLATDNQILEPLCELGLRRFAAGVQAPVRELKANYVRPSDAELGRKLGPAQ